MPKAYFYKLSYDVGQAPNPFGGILTFSCCMHEIRELIEKGDFLIGIGSTRLDEKIKLNPNAPDLETTDGKIIYVMQVTDLKTFPEYVKYIRELPEGHPLKIKLPELPPITDPNSKRGDAIYRFEEGEENEVIIIALPCLHLKDKLNTPDKLHIEAYQDIVFGKHVLLSEKFVYYGQDLQQPAENLSALLKALDLKIDTSSAITKTEFKAIPLEEYPDIHQTLENMIYTAGGHAKLADPCMEPSLDFMKQNKITAKVLELSIIEKLAMDGGKQGSMLDAFSRKRSSASLVSESGSPTAKLRAG